MEDLLKKYLLKKYLQKENNWNYIYITYWEVDGANCEVTYYTDESRHYKEHSNINIWDMMIFLNVL
jgi:hypothetical protein